MTPAKAPLERVLARGHRCPACYLHKKLCICADIPRITTTTRITIIRHWLEAYKVSNTGRLIDASVTNAEIVDYARPNTAPLDLDIDENTWVLYPIGTHRPSPAAPCKRLLVLDATWKQARRMYQRISQLRGCQIFSLNDANNPIPALRKTPDQKRVSTISAVAKALSYLDDQDSAEALISLGTQFYERTTIRSRRQRFTSPVSSPLDSE